MDTVWFILIGIVAGWLASLLMKGGDFGLVGCLVIGVIGAFVGGHVLGVLGIAATGIVARLVTATLGAMAFIALLRFIRRKVR
jgi:uncharacterized membrane protein YeaQ/YmgE (transglycosylase-associated protein family)